MKERLNSKILFSLMSLFLFASGQTIPASTVKFKLLRDYMIIVPVRVNGAGPYEFLLDTGTNTTVLSAEFARQLRLRPIDRIELVTVAGSQIVLRSQLERLTLGTAEAAGLEVLFSDLSGVRSVEPSIRGILGMNFLSRFNYLINYSDRRIEFEEAERFRGLRVPFEWREERMLVTVPLASEKERALRLVLDTGAHSPILFEESARKAGVDSDRRGSQRTLVTTDSGSRLARQTSLRTVRVGSETFFDLPVTVLDSQGTDRVEDGLLPARLFRSIYFNHRDHYVIFNPQVLK